MSYKRKMTREVRVGDVKIGCNNPISVQSMTNTDTRDVEKTVAQIKRLEEVGCDIVRVAVVDMDAAKSISKIKEQVNIPIIADIHFDYRLALEAIEQGVDGIRINPGNIGSVDRVKIKKEFIEIVKYAKEKGFITIVSTNQAGVSYGYYTEEDVKKVHKYIYEEYKKCGALIDDFYYCPYHIKSENKKYNIISMMRKPESGMHLLASKKYNIDLSASFMIGDRDTDIIKIPYLKTLLIETPAYKIINRENIIDTKDIYYYLQNGDIN